MRVLFLGSPEFAVPSLKALIMDSDFEVLAVVTQPDRKAKRGQRLTPPPVKILAVESGIPVFQFPRIRDNWEAQELLNNLQPEIMVVVAFGQILPSDFFDFPVHGTLNVHASLLPAYRGAAPIAHAILNGERTSGVTIMRIDEGMDTGDVLTQKVVPILESCSAGELEELLAKEGADLLVRTMKEYVSGVITPAPQSSEGVSYAPRIGKEDGKVCWKESASEIHNRVRAMNPWPGATTSFREMPLKIWETAVGGSLSEGVSDPSEGTVVNVERGGVVVRCAGPSYLSLLTLQLPNRKRIAAGDFANGTQLKVGERLG